MKIDPSETVIKGRWITDVNKQVVGDDVCDRVQELVCNYLVRITSDWSGWETLYRDPTDNRFWEHTYPHGEMHGGGPPMLRNITEAEAKEKYMI